jgi:hypothetical protein
MESALSYNVFDDLGTAQSTSILYSVSTTTVGTQSTSITGGSSSPVVTSSGAPGISTSSSPVTSPFQTYVSGFTTDKSSTTSVSLTSTIGTSTTRYPCIEIELIETLVTANLIDITPEVTIKKDLYGTGIDFTENSPVFEITLPNDGAVVRDLSLPSANVVKVEVTFILTSNDSPKVIRGSPTSLPIDEFPLEEVEKVIIKVVKTSDDKSPRRVKLSVIVCSETPSTTTKLSSES